MKILKQFMFEVCYFYSLRFFFLTDSAILVLGTLEQKIIKNKKKKLIVLEMNLQSYAVISPKLYNSSDVFKERSTLKVNINNINMLNFKQWTLCHLSLFVSFIVSGLLINAIQLCLYCLIGWWNRSLFRKLNYYLVWMIYAQVSIRTLCLCATAYYIR